jgi:hypothetical protein
MKIRVLLGPNAGVVTNADGAAVHLLCKLGLVEEVLPNADPKPPTGKLTWKVIPCKDEIGTPRVNVSCSCGTGVTVLPSAGFRWGHCGVSEQLPAAINAEYRHIWDREAKQQAAMAYVDLQQPADKVWRDGSWHLVGGA